MAASTLRSNRPLWTKLHYAWRGSGRHGLTLPFLCAGAGEQPATFVRDLVELGPCFTFCDYRLRPVLRLLACDTVGAVADVSDAGAPSAIATRCTAYFRKIVGWPELGPSTTQAFAAALEACLMQQILSNEVSVNSNGAVIEVKQIDGPFNGCDRRFIRSVLGPKYPPTAVGPTAKGGIEYAWRSGKRP